MRATRLSWTSSASATTEGWSRSSCTRAAATTSRPRCAAGTSTAATPIRRGRRSISTRPTTAQRRRGRDRQRLQRPRGRARPCVTPTTAPATATGPAAGRPVTPFGGGAPLGQMHIGTRTFDYNNDGLANIGLYPDFIAICTRSGSGPGPQPALPLRPRPTFGCGSRRATCRLPRSRAVCRPRAGARPTSSSRAPRATTRPIRPPATRRSRSRRASRRAPRRTVPRRPRATSATSATTASPSSFHGPEVDRKAPSVLRGTGLRVARGRRRAALHVDRGWIRLRVRHRCVVQPGDGTETDNASTGSRTVCDLVANCSTVGPVGGIKVDKKAPVIVISSPAATSYLHNSTLTLGYTVTDGGSGVATGPTLDGSGTVGGHGHASGQAINLLTESHSARTSSLCRRPTRSEMCSNRAPSRSRWS